jgi:hypothetical protein
VETYLDSGTMALGVSASGGSIEGGLKYFFGIGA